MSVTIPVAVFVVGCLGIAALTGLIIIMAALLREGEREADRQQEEIFRLRRKWAHAAGVIKSPGEVAPFDQHAATAVAVANSVQWVEPTAAQLASWVQTPGYDWREQ